MSMLLKSGISVIDSLEMSHDVIRNKKVKSELKIVQRKLIRKIYYNRSVVVSSFL